MGADVALGSVRFQTFADYADLQNARVPIIDGGEYNKALVLGTIRQRVNSVNGYKHKYEQVQDIIKDYRTLILSKYSDQRIAQNALSNTLTQLKDHAIYIKAQHSSHT